MKSQNHFIFKGKKYGNATKAVTAVKLGQSAKKMANVKVKTKTVFVQFSLGYAEFASFCRK